MKSLKKILTMGVAAVMMFTGTGGVSFSAKNDEGLAAYGLRTLGMDCPLGIGTKAPELSWKLISGKNNSCQTAYEIEASDSEDFADIIWNSGVVESEKPFGVFYGRSFQRSGNCLRALH